MIGAKTQQLLRQVALRRRLVTGGAAFRWTALGVAAVLLAGLLVTRLLALLPDWFTLSLLWLVPATAAAVALVVALFRNVSASQAAHLVDARMETRDLFLNVSLMDSSPGAYKPIVFEQAEARAGGIAAGKVVPFHWWQGTRDTFLAVGVLFLAIAWLPQLDPFGRQEQRKKLAAQEKRLEDTKKATALRAELLEKKGPDARTDQIDKALAKLEQTFQIAKPKEPQANLQNLMESQKELGQLWKELNKEKLANALKQASNQSFGAADLEKMQKWKDDLAKGDTGSLKKELGELEDLAKKLADMPDSAEKRQLQEELRRRTEELANALAKELNSQPLNEALARALEQLDLSKLGNLSQDALQGMAESLQLTEKELEALAQAMKDLQSLEEALGALQLAKKLNDGEKLDGEAAGACKGQGMQSYAELYAEMMAAMAGGGTGEGMKGPGIGEGGLAPEKNELETAYKPEQSQSALQAGKMLLQWQTKGVSESGKANEEYLQSIRQVKQGVSEAILSEQVPPGYHDAIQKYFDTLDQQKPK